MSRFLEISVELLPNVFAVAGLSIIFLFALKRISLKKKKKKNLPAKTNEYPKNIENQQSNFSHGRTKSVVVETKRKRIVKPKQSSATRPATSGTSRSQSSGDSKRPGEISDAEMERRLKALQAAKTRESEEAAKQVSEKKTLREERSEAANQSRKLPTQSARRPDDDPDQKDLGRGGSRDGFRRSAKLTLNQALSGDGGRRQKSLAAMKRKQERARKKALTRTLEDEKAIRGVDAPKRSYVVRPVLYGTDRRSSFDGNNNCVFSGERGGELLLGEATVSVPLRHRVGSIERPFSLSLFGVDIVKFSENPEFHFMEITNKLLSESEFRTNGSLRALVSNKYERTAFVFVHGFNVPFRNAIFTAAQIAFDINFDGPVYAYCWPSGGKPSDYIYDMDSTRISLPHFSNFLNIVSSTKGVDKIHIVAHSMGNAALGGLVSPDNPYIEKSTTSEFSQLIMAAPDLDTDIFRETYHHFVGFGKGVTLYAAQNDRALILSRVVRRGHPRAGDSPPHVGPIVVEGVDTIDVTEVDTSFFSLNHSKFVTSRNLLNDVGILLQSGMRPPDRRIPTAVKITGSSGDYWKLPK